MSDKETQTDQQETVAVVESDSEGSAPHPDPHTMQIVTGGAAAAAAAAAEKAEAAVTVYSTPIPGHAISI